MNIVLFKDITAIENIEMLEREGKKYTGLYVDMNDKEQRKYVKDNAVLINDIIKKIDRSRIDQKKAFGLSVEAEAKAITDRLQAANLPFSMLIDAYKHERAEILAAEKAKTEAAALVLQIEADHDHALLMDKVQMIEKAEREQKERVRVELMAEELAESSIKIERARTAAEAKQAEQELRQREADKQHVSNIRREAKEAFMNWGMDEVMARAVVMSIHDGNIPNVSISY